MLFLENINLFNQGSRT